MFNMDDGIIKSFTHTVATLLDVAFESVRNVRAVTQYSNSDSVSGGVRRFLTQGRRRIDSSDAVGCDIIYEIVSPSEEMATEISNAIKRPSGRFQQPESFSTSFQQAMIENDVSASFASAITAEPTLKVIQLSRAEESSDATSEVEASDKKGDGSGSSVLIATIAVVGAAVAVLVFLWKQKSKTKAIQREAARESADRGLEMAIVVESVAEASPGQAAETRMGLSPSAPPLDVPIMHNNPVHTSRGSIKLVL